MGLSRGDMDIQVMREPVSTSITSSSFTISSCRTTCRSIMGTTWRPTCMPQQQSWVSTQGSSSNKWQHFRRLRCSSLPPCFLPVSLRPPCTIRWEPEEVMAQQAVMVLLTTTTTSQETQPEPPPDLNKARGARQQPPPVTTLLTVVRTFTVNTAVVAAVVTREVVTVAAWPGSLTRRWPHYSS